MTLATLRALAVAEQMPDWWIAHLDAYRKKYPRHTAAQYFAALKSKDQAREAFMCMLNWPGGGYNSAASWRLRKEILGQPWSFNATTAQLSAALSRAFEED